MPIDWSTLHKILRDETRKKIVFNLQTAGQLTYTELMNRLEITNTGKLNYHLKKLNDLISKNNQGAYTLTERGKAAAELLEKFPEQMATSRALKASDAAIIALVGLLLTGVPTFLVLFIFPAGMLIPPVFLLLYLLLIPAFTMWSLVTRRTASHDLYELVKPPVIALGIFYLVILIAFFIPSILAASPPPPTTNTTTTTQTVYISGFVLFFLFPLLPLMGVILIEGFYRFRHR